MSILNINTPSGGVAGEVYSTEETRIGTWIDGKPLYRKVFYLPNGIVWDPPQMGLLIDIADKGKTVNLSGFIQHGGESGYYYPLPYMEVDSDGEIKFLELFSSGNYILSKYNFTRESWPVGKPAYIIVEYTKTTD